VSAFATVLLTHVIKTNYGPTEYSGYQNSCLDFVGTRSPWEGATTTLAHNGGLLRAIWL
jgi:hypothetical protein